MIFIKGYTFVSSFIGSFVGFALVYFSQSDLSLGNTAVFFITVMGYLSNFIFGIHIGYWCDKYRLKKIFIINSLLIAFSFFIFLTLLFLDNKFFYTLSLSVTSFLISLCVYFSSIVLSSVIPKFYSKNLWHKVNSNINFYRMLGVISGLSVGSLIADLSANESIFYVFGLSVLCMCAISLFYKSSSYISHDIPKLKIKDLILSSFEPIFKNKTLSTMLGHGFVSNLATGMIQVSLYLYLYNILNISPEVIGLLFIFRHLGGVFISKLLSHFEIDVGIKFKLVVVSMLNGAMWAGFYFIQPFIYVELLVAILLFLISANSTVFNLEMSVFRMSVVSVEEQGRSLAAIRFVLFSSLPLGALLGYMLMELTSLRTVFLISGFVTFISSLLLITIKFKCNNVKTVDKLVTKA